MRSSWRCMIRFFICIDILIVEVFRLFFTAVSRLGPHIR